MEVNALQRIKRILAQPSLGARLGFGTQTGYEAPSDLQVESRIKTQRLISG